MKSDNDNVRDAQLVMLNLLEAFDKVCKKHGLTYWIDHGTLLGAIRHTGFIPWDDDLDVTMPREDYEKFLSIAEKELPKDIFLQTRKSDPHTHVYHAKLRDRNSTYIEEWQLGKEIDAHQGIFIDIFPVNYIEKRRSDHYKLLVSLSKLFWNRYLRVEMAARPLIKLLNSFHKQEHTFIVSGGENMHYVIHVDKRSVFPLSTVEFEGMSVPAPNDTDTYLRSIFGDSYMTPPPKEKQKVHSVYISTNEPCRYEKVRDNA